MQFLAHKSEAPRFEIIEYKSVRPERIYEFRDVSGRFNGDKRGVMGHIVIDNTSWSDKGVAKGGTAMYLGCTLETTAKKAHVMTRKQIPCHPIGQDSCYERWGGAKGGIDFAKFTDGSKDAELVWRGVVQSAWAAGIVPKKYIFGLDVGTNEMAAAAAVDQVGDSLVITGKPRELGGVEYDKQGFAGRGTVLVAREMCLHRKIRLEDPSTRIVIEGFGAVGVGVAQGLVAGLSEARVVAISDADADHAPFCIYSDKGLDIDELMWLKGQSGSIASYADGERAEFIQKSATEVPCDVLFLASSKISSIDENNANSVSCRVVAQGANLGVTEKAAEILSKRKILSLPDYLTNYASSASVLVEHAYARGKIKPNDLVAHAWGYVKKTMKYNTMLILQTMSHNGLPALKVGDMIIKNEFDRVATERQA